MAKEKHALLMAPGTPLPPGAVQVHFGHPETALVPRGSMMKNSLGETIAEKLLSSWEHWTDPKYADNPHPEDLLNMLIEQAHTELGAAIEALKANHRVDAVRAGARVNGSKPRC